MSLANIKWAQKKKLHIWYQLSKEGYMTLASNGS